jgi:hypothetical protein
MIRAQGVHIIYLGESVDLTGFTGHALAWNRAACVSPLIPLTCHFFLEKA